MWEAAAENAIVDIQRNSKLRHADKDCGRLMAIRRNEARRDKGFRNRTSCRAAGCRCPRAPSSGAGQRRFRPLLLGTGAGARRGENPKHPSGQRGAGHTDRRRHPRQRRTGLKRAALRCCSRPWARGAREGGALRASAPAITVREQAGRAGGRRQDGLITCAPCAPAHVVPVPIHSPRVQCRRRVKIVLS